MSNIYTVYRATNVDTKKCYVGFDSSWPNRKYFHEYSAFKKNSNDYKFAFHRAIRKHGPETFKWEVLYQSKDRDHTLKIMEPHFIKENCSYAHWQNGGYNLTLGGDGAFGIIPWNKGRVGVYTEETINKMRQPKSEEWKQKMRRPQTQDHILKRAAAQSKKWEITTPIGKIIQVKNLCEFARQNNLIESGLRQVSYGKRNHHGGYKCRKI
jgi:hypothetical protein